MMRTMLSLEKGKDPVKLDVKVPGYLTVMLAMTVDYALSSNDPGNYLRKLISDDDGMQLREMTETLVGKARLEDFYKDVKEINQG